MLTAAVAAPGPTTCVFAIDEAMLTGMHASPNRVRFLRESLTDLEANLSGIGLSLTVLRGDWAQEISTFATQRHATSVHVTDDVSQGAQRRLNRLSTSLGSLQLVRHEGIMVVAPSAITTGGGAYKVFTPYYRRWLETPWRSMLQPPKAEPQLDGPIPSASSEHPLATHSSVIDSLDVAGPLSPNVDLGGETAGLTRLRHWTSGHLHEYGDIHDDLSADATSRIAPYLHFGCLSPLEVATRLRDRAGAEPFIRQLCWRDFYHQFLAAHPTASVANVRERNDRWNDDDDGFAAWCEGRTGFPIVDAAMRQLHLEGFMHNRARMIVASFLTKDLYIDWRRGAKHFMQWLVDGDVANNQLNWQWTAGTGTDTNPHRILSPHRQAERFDPHGDYIRRYVVELADVPGKLALDPDVATRARCNYPLPIVDHQLAIQEFKTITKRAETLS